VLKSISNTTWIFLVFYGLPIACYALAHVSIKPALALAVVAIPVPFVSVFFYKLNYRSVKAFFTLGRSNLINLAISMFWANWGISYLNHLHDLYVHHIYAIASLYVLSFVCSCYFFIRADWPNACPYLGAYRSAGQISANSFYEALMIGQANKSRLISKAVYRNVMALVPVTVGIASLFFGRMIVGLFFFVVTGIWLSSFILAITAVESWMLHKHLGSDDLKIV
jgi:hypothetical protein